jgi:drug/metabolite transporter (DMT)-like permease
VVIGRSSRSVPSSHEKPSSSRPPLTAIAFAAIDLIWGSTYLAIRIAVGAIPPLLLMGVRWTAAGLLLLAWAAARREHATVAQWRHAAVAGALMIGITYGALTWAEQRLAPGIAALLSATSPLWLTTMQWPDSGRPGTRTWWACCSVAVVLGWSVGGESITPPREWRPWSSPRPSRWS